MDIRFEGDFNRSPWDRAISWVRCLMPSHLVFSWFADAGAWPEHPGSAAAVVDEAVVGPMRLLDHLETMLGLGGPANPGVKRIAIYRRKLEAAGPERFWSASFAVDSWSVARELLGWRDDLIEAGWRPDARLAPKRLADLAAAEMAGPDLPLGSADRLRAVIYALREKRRLHLGPIELVDIRALLPAGWRALFDALESWGVVIAERLDARLPASDNDLRRLASPLGADGSLPTITGDTSLSLLVADTELAAAEALAAWLAADEKDNEGVVFVLGKDTALLDHALARAGLPRLGASAPSPHRALLQVLPLAYALAWNPPDPNRLLDFLLLPIGPLPRRVANRLARAIAEEPGVGGPKWLEAWADIEKQLAEAEDEDTRKRAKRLAEWRAFVEPQRHDPLGGMPRLVARCIAERISAWASSRFGTTDDPLFLFLATIAGDLAAAIDATESEKLDRLLIERMIEQAIGVGVADPTATAEAAPWRAVSHPGAVWGEAKTIIWWHFADSGETGGKVVWDTNERAALRDAGCPLDESELALQLIATAWQRPLRYADQRLIFVRPVLSGGTETMAHPLWHSLAAGRPDLESQIGFHAEKIFRDAAPSFAGRTLTRHVVAAISLPRSRAEWTASATAISQRELESATSLSTLLACPLQWTLKYASKLEPSVRQSLPGNDTLFGTLAHKIAEEIFVPGPPPDPDTVLGFAATRLEELLTTTAATLLLPGAARDLTAAREAIPEALAELARFLQSTKLSVVGTEHEFSQADTLGQGTGVRGSVDLLAQDKARRPVVIDLKWQHTDRYRRSEIADGVAIQLSVYARHVGGAKADTATGYFMLRQKRFVTGSSLFQGEAIVVDGPAPQMTWDKITKSWAEAMAEIGKGTVRAPFEQNGVQLNAFADPYLLTPPKCQHCDYLVLCGGDS
jgi:ATP-dependent helicase/nuclease subunit B